MKYYSGINCYPMNILLEQAKIDDLYIIFPEIIIYDNLFLM